MKRVIMGVALAVSAAGLCAATRGVGSAMRSGNSVMASEGKLGPVRFYFGIKGVLAVKDVRVISHMTTSFKAGYIFAPRGSQTFETQWNSDYDDKRGTAGYVRPMATTDLGLGDVSAATTTFVFDGTHPSRWLVDGGAAGAWAVGDLQASTEAIIRAACFDNARRQSALVDKALVPSADRVAHGQNVTNFDYIGWGMRFEGGLGFNVVDNLALFVLCSYKFDFKNKDAKTSQDDASFAQSVEQAVTFDAAGGTAKLSGDLLRASFAYNNNELASGVKITAKVTETFGVMGGLDWRPWSALSLYAKVGVKRYAFEVSYEGGDLAYPGTVGMFSEAFTKENGRYNLLVAQGKDVRKLKAVGWPLAFGGGVRAVYGVHSLDLGVDYASCEQKLSLENSKTTKSSTKKKDGDDAEGYTTENTIQKRSLTNPYSGTPSYAQMRDNQGIHQFLATDVVNAIETKVVLHDLTFSAGYTLTL